MCWLDLACGRGQIIGSLNNNISDEARAKIEFWAYDLDHKYARVTSQTAEQMGFAALESRVGDLSDFDKLLPRTATFDFITLTNTVHEVEPNRLAQLLIHCLARLSDTGTLFIYDMEHIRPPELGAVPWNRNDVRLVVQAMMDSLGVQKAYRPEVSQWQHKTTNGWNVQFQREHFGIDTATFQANMECSIEKTTKEIVRLLQQRLVGCTDSLKALTQYGAETPKEQEDKERLLYEFWALSRALNSVT